MLEHLSELKSDPILSLMVEFQNDPRPEKVDLGIGVYKNESGQTPMMAAVKQAQLEIANQQASKSYVGLAGNSEFNAFALQLVLNKTSVIERSIAIQTPGASGALRMLADLIYAAKPVTTVWLSDPSYVNHQPVMEAAGLTVKHYPYFDPTTKRVNVDAMLEALSCAGADDVVLFHACCHNPTGADLSASDWQAIAQLAKENGFTPFVDLAYQGFGDGIGEDLYGLELLANQADEMFIAMSCSKSFGLYRERTGAAIVVAENAQNAQIAKGKLLQLARGSYTMPPDHGAAIVAKILTDQHLTQSWQDELNHMRVRMLGLRQSFTQALRRKFQSDVFDFITDHKGMFSILGLTPEQVMRLKTDFGIYMVGDSRINIAGLTDENIEYVAEAIFQVSCSTL